MGYGVRGTGYGVPFYFTGKTPKASFILKPSLRRRSGP